MLDHRADLGTARRDLAAIKAEQAALTPAQVLESLRRGNERFASGKTEPRDMLHDQQITAAGQYPHAVILSCIDSRAPAEFIFDAGLGDLFNARIAGNIADADLVGSMEFACAVSGAKLVLVMGHTSCGAIKGACDHVQLGNLTGLLDKIQPAVEAVQRRAGRTQLEEHDFVEAVSEANVRLTVERIRELSPILRDLESAGKIQIAGCIYDLGAKHWPQTLMQRLRLGRAGVRARAGALVRRRSVAGERSAPGSRGRCGRGGALDAGLRHRRLLGDATGSSDLGVLADEVVDLQRFEASVHPDDWHLVRGAIERSSHVSPTSSTWNTGFCSRGMATCAGLPPAGGLNSVSPGNRSA